MQNNLIKREEDLALLILPRVSACACEAKVNVPFVRMAKIVFKKCAVGKNKNTEALAVRSAVSRFNCPVTF